MKEYSSNRDEIKERIDIVNYKLSVVCYLIDEITKRIGKDNDNYTPDKEIGEKEENKNKEDTLMFYEQIQKLLSSSGNETHTVEETLMKKPHKNTNTKVNIDTLKSYLPLLNQIKISQEGEIFILKKALKSHKGL